MQGTPAVFPRPKKLSQKASSFYLNNKRTAKLLRVYEIT